jgi:hypothetical protein
MAATVIGPISNAIRRLIAHCQLAAPSSGIGIMFRVKTGCPAAFVVVVRPPAGLPAACRNRPDCSGGSDRN